MFTDNKQVNQILLASFILVPIFAVTVVYAPEHFAEINSKQYADLEMALSKHQNNEPLKKLVANSMADHKITIYEYNQIMGLINNDDIESSKQKIVKDSQ